MYACCLLYVWVGPKPYVKTKCFVSYSFDFVIRAHESKVSIYRHHILYPLQLGPLLPNNVRILKPKVSLGPSQMKIDLRKVFMENITYF